VSAVNPFQPSSTPRLAEVRHSGSCGERFQCFRATCRSAYPGYRTVEVLPDGRALCYCHGEIYPRGDLILRRLAA
jgi:hypothetical protein